MQRTVAAALPTTPKPSSTLPTPSPAAITPTRPPATPSPLPATAGPTAVSPRSPTAATASKAVIAPCILSFSAGPSKVNPGDRVTLTWQATGEEAHIVHDEEWGSLSTDSIDIPLSGTTTVTVDPALRRTRITYFLYVRSRGESVSTSATVWLTCPEQWFFPYPPQGCPRPAKRTTVVAQYFERGMMLWSSAEKRIYFLEAAQGPLSQSFTYSFADDLWREGMPESDPNIVPPQGLYQPVRGFGLVWRTKKDSFNRSLRDKLGWATDREFTVGEGYVQEWAHGKQLDSYITGPNNTVIELPSMGSARTVPTPTPGPSPTRLPDAHIAAPQCPTPAPTAPGGDSQITLDQTLAEKVLVRTLLAPESGPDPYPAYTELTFWGYVNWDYPKMAIYPAEEYQRRSSRFREGLPGLTKLLAGPVSAAAIKELKLPFLPDAYKFILQPKRLEFQNGSGVLFLSQYVGVTEMITNPIYYAFIGLTSDSRYCVYAVFPVDMPFSPQELAEIEAIEKKDYGAERTKAAQAFDQRMQDKIAGLAAEGFTPSLTKLDAMLQSLRVQ